MCPTAVRFADRLVRLGYATRLTSGDGRYFATIAGREIDASHARIASMRGLGFAVRDVLWDGIGTNCSKRCAFSRTRDAPPQ